MQTQCSVGAAARVASGMARFQKWTRLPMSAVAVPVLLLTVSGCAGLEAGAACRLLSLL